jgi:hypothetical protein
MWVAVAVADFCLSLKLKLSPTPGLPIDCCVVVLGSRARHDAPGALRGPFFHSGHVARTQRSFFPSRHVAVGGTFSRHLPFPCC